MQLTKDDIKTSQEIRIEINDTIEAGELDCLELMLYRKQLDFSKFQQVVEFYKKYRYFEAMLRDQQKDAWSNWIKSNEFKIYKKEAENKNYVVAEQWYQDWLFNYCFVEGLK